MVTKVLAYRAYDQQTIHFNEVLKKTQAAHQAQRTDMFRATQEHNLQLAKEKRDAELR